MAIYYEQNKSELAFLTRVVRKRYIGVSNDPNRTHVDPDEMETQVAYFLQMVNCFLQQFVLLLFNMRALWSDQLDGGPDVRPAAYANILL